MGKLSQKDRSAKTPKQKKRVRCSKNKYLKPGALAQLRDIKALAATKSCTDLGKKRVAVLDAEERVNGAVFQDKGSSSILSPERLGYNSRIGPLDSLMQNNLQRTPKTPRSVGCGSRIGTLDLLMKNNIQRSPKTPRAVGCGSRIGPLDLLRQNNLERTPKTPRTDGCESESRFESLPMDLLVKILCHLHHDQLAAVFHVSQRIRKATVIARQHHFNYTTPDRSRQEMLRTMTPLPTEHWPFVSKSYGKNVRIPTPNTPKAPRQGPRPPSRLKFAEMRQITAVLFQESARCNVPSVIAKPICKPFASNRVLFYEDELCKAVAQNKLL